MRRLIASAHLSDQQLLLHLDEELARGEAARVRRHVDDCPQCWARLEAMRLVSADVEQEYAGAKHVAHDASGPRALLKARLAETAAELKGREPMRLGFARIAAYGCALVVLVALGVRVFVRPLPVQRVLSSQPLPDPRITPGATREVSLGEICSLARDEVVRSVPGQLQQQVFREYGISGVPANDFEVDYLITPGLGGSTDVRNLWPEPHTNTTWNSYVKDQLEDRLHRMVCDRKVALDVAQRDIATDWIAAYKKYFDTDRPLVSQPSPREAAGVRAD
jgi:anti-sigma factor RsiW